MKKTLLLAAVITLGLASCTTVKKTATSVDVKNSLVQESNVDLTVSPERVTFNFRPMKAERKGGLQNVKNCAVRELLKNNGNAEVLVAPEFDVRVRRGFFGQTKIKEVTVSGHPATYKNFKNK